MVLMTRFSRGNVFVRKRCKFSLWCSKVCGKGAEESLGRCPSNPQKEAGCFSRTFSVKQGYDDYCGGDNDSWENRRHMCCSYTMHQNVCDSKYFTYYFLPGTHCFTISRSQHLISQLPHSFIKQLYLRLLKEPPQYTLLYREGLGKHWWEMWAIWHPCIVVSFIHISTLLLQEY